MDFNLKKLAGEASGLFNRAKQLTEEKLLNAEKTELGKKTKNLGPCKKPKLSDPNFERLLHRADKTEEQTKKLLTAMETYLQPNPGFLNQLFRYFKA